MGDDDFDEGAEEVITKAGLIDRIGEESRTYLEKFKSEFDSYVLELREFIAGKRGFLTFWGSIRGAYLRYIGLDDLEERAEAVFDEVDALAREKGFRSNINTYNDHLAIGSTMWIKYSEQPDVPIGVLKHLWNLGDSVAGGESLTIEEARRARELYGQTTLDENGVVTGEINPDVKDSYHFLSPERKREVIELENKSLEDLEAISQEAYTKKERALADFRGYVLHFIEGEDTIEDAQKKAGEIKRMTERDFSKTIGEARELSYREGYRDFYLTPQEIIIMGREVDEKYLQKPWTPLGVQEGALSVEKAQELRKKEKEIRWMTSVFCEFEMPFPIPFEELNESGETVGGPNGKDARMAEHFKDRANVPYSRQGDWYHKE